MRHTLLRALREKDKFVINGAFWHHLIQMTETNRNVRKRESYLIKDKDGKVIESCRLKCFATTRKAQLQDIMKEELHIEFNPK